MAISKKSRVTASSMTLALMLCNGVTAVHAQDVRPATATSGGDAGSVPPATAATAAETALEAGDIVVTANKRSETASRVGLSITAFSADTLKARNITTPSELARTVPGLDLAPSTHGTPVFTLRGVGYNSDSLAVYPAVSVSLDQAPLTFPVLASHSMYDLERVEVLKGPQGILFGQNSTGGAINYVAAKPTAAPHAGLSLAYGRFNEVHGTGFVSGPVSDNLNFRFAVDGARRDGWQYNYTRDDRNAKQKYIAGRLILDWQASDDLKVEFNLNGSLDRSEPQALQLIGVIPSAPAAPSAAELTAPLAPNNNRAANWSITSPAANGIRAATKPAEPAGNRKLAQAFLRLDLNLTDSVTLTSISTFNHLDQKMSFDLDGSQYELVDGPVDDGRITDLSQELRLSNAAEAGQQFRWTVGANYNHSKTFENQNISYGDNSLSNAGTNFIHITGARNSGRIDNYAAFASGEYDLARRLTLKAGVRYTKSINRNSECDYDGSPDNLENELFSNLGLLLGGQFIPLVQGQCYPLNENGLPINAQGVVGGPVNETLNESNVSWRAGLDFKASQTTLFYANISRGYKAGSFPVITPSLQSQLTPAKQESVTAYEAGFKTRLADNAISWSGAIFYNDYRDKQIQGTVNTPLFGLLQRLDNIPKSRVYGVETDVTLRPIKGLTLTGSASYLDTKVQNYTSTSVYGVTTDFAGDRLPFAPKWTLVGDASYEIPTANGGNIFVGASANYRTDVDAYVGGRTLAVPDNGVNRSITTYPFRIAGYTLVDARLGYEIPGNRATFTLWGKNIFNAFNVQNAISYNDVITRATGMPATYGVRLDVKW